MSGVEIFVRDADGVAVPVSDTHPLPTTGSSSGGGGSTDMGPTNTLLGAKTEVAPADDTASSGLNGRLQRIAQRLTDLIAATGSSGGTDMTATNTLLGAVNETAPLTDIASSGLNGRLQRASQRLTSLIGQLPATIGQKARAASLAVAQSAEDQAQIGGLTETAPASDTASSGLNGRLQRIAQNVSSLIAKWPAALGSLAAASSLAVTASTEDVARVGAITETAPASDTASSGLNGRLQRIAQRLSTVITSGIPAFGTTANGATLTSAPVTMGGLAKTTPPTPVTDGQVVNALFDKNGKQITVPAQREMKGIQYTAGLATTTETTIVTGAVGWFNDLYGLVLCNRSSTGCWVVIKDSTAGVIRFVIYVPANDTRGFMLDAGSAVPQAATNTNWTATLSAAVSAMEITALYIGNK